jgi:hypothetical protein
MAEGYSSSCMVRPFAFILLESILPITIPHSVFETLHTVSVILVISGPGHLTIAHIGGYLDVLVLLDRLSIWASIGAVRAPMVLLPFCHISSCRRGFGPGMTCY